MRSNLPDKNLFLGKCVPTHADLKLIAFIKSGNDGHVFRGHDKELQREFACKVIPRSNLVGELEGKDTWRAEIEKANRLSNRAPVVKFAGKHEWKDLESGVDCIVLVADFIQGDNLNDFIKRNKSEISMPFIVQFLETMLDFFNEMEAANVHHGDFHAGNILVEDRKGALRGERYEFRVTDFGVAAATSSDTRFKDDYFQLAFILRQLLEAFDYPAAEPKEQFIFNKLNDDFLAKHLVEKDQTLDPIARRPDKLYERLQRLEDDYEQFALVTDTSLLSPFDFLSCEQIGDVPSILKALYSDLFLGLDDIESRNNVVVTGPRGCGKSTVFRNLSLRQQYRVGEATPDNIAYIGVYYFCNDLYFTFPRYKLPGRPEAWDIPIHFLTATLLTELFEDVCRWADHYYKEEFQRNQQRVVRKLFETLEIDPPKEPGGESFKALEAELQKNRRRAIHHQRNAHLPDHEFGILWGADKLLATCKVLHDSFTFLRNRPIYFFIDDYSAPKVTKKLQENLNRVLMQRSSYCFFKLATESPVSFSPRDLDQKEYVEAREFNLLNLGQIFLRDESGRKLNFIEDVFQRRLAAATSFPVKDLETLVGNHPNQSFNEDAEEIRRVHRLKHWGKQTLANLCSGDIHYVINLVRVMVAGTERIESLSDVPRIPEDVQDKCIRLEAGKFLNNLRGSCEQGEKLVAIVTAFGKVASSYLHHRASQNQDNAPAWQASRVEPYEQLNLAGDARILYDELLRYSVFIQDFRGKSRRGDVVPRLFLRRFLIPYFNLTFSTRDSIQLESRDFELMLLDPSAFEKRFRQKTSNRVNQEEEGELPLV